MPKVVFVQHDGECRTVEVPEGTSVMKAALENGIQGIDGDCGGQCACGTCHVFVEAEWRSLAGTPNTREAEMLSFADGATSASRLACQIEMTESLDGLTVRLPAGQH